MKKAVLLIGLLIISISWFLYNADQFPMIYRIVVPKYVKSISVYKKMNKPGYVLKQGSEDFEVMIEMINDYVLQDENRRIIKIKTKDWAHGFLQTEEGPRWNNYIELELTYSKPYVRCYRFHGFDKMIEKKYLNIYIYTWSGIVFWVGILISALSIFIRDTKDRGRGKIP